MPPRSAQCNLGLKKGNCTAIRIDPRVHVKSMDVLLLKKTLILSEFITICVDGDEGALSVLFNSGQGLDKKAAVRRVRVTLSEVRNPLTCTEFKLALRMTLPTFVKLLDRLRSYLVRNSVMDNRSRGRNAPCKTFGAHVEDLAGCSYLDQMMCRNVCRSTVYMAFTETVRVINSDILMPEVPLESESALRGLAEGFLYSTERPGLLYGCVGTKWNCNSYTETTRK